MTTPIPDDLHAIERELDELYAAGHRTGHGAGGPAHPGCDGCARALDVANAWDAYWTRFDVRRRGDAEVAADAAATQVVVDGVVVAETRRIDPVTPEERAAAIEARRRAEAAARLVVANLEDELGAVLAKLARARSELSRATMAYLDLSAKLARARSELSDTPEEELP